MRLFIYLIIIVKVIFILLALAYLYYKLKKKTDDPKAKRIQFWKERLEFVFIFLMSILMLSLFYPKSPQKPMNYETRLLLFLFGIILLITADWGAFIHESPLLTHIQSILSTSKRFNR